ncbi:MAG: hypothetical protein QW761_02925 [Candidatus Aenigmatarchaeota archaeon]
MARLVVVLTDTHIIEPHLEAPRYEVTIYNRLDHAMVFSGRPDPQKPLGAIALDFKKVLDEALKANEEIEVPIWDPYPTEPTLGLYRVYEVDEHKFPDPQLQRIRLRMRGK